MNIGLKTGLLIVSIAAFIVVIFTVVKRRMNIKYSVVWILWAMLLLFMSMFPETFYKISHLLGIEMPVNTVFLIMTALLYALTFYVYITISKHNEEIIKLTYEISALKKEVEELKKNNER